MGCVTDTKLLQREPKISAILYFSCNLDRDHLGITRSVTDWSSYGYRWNRVYPVRTHLPASAMELRTSRACAMPLANRVASSLLPKLSPHTCRASRHWWKLGVAWLYLRPLTIGQFITTYGSKRTDDQYKGRFWREEWVIVWFLYIFIKSDSFMVWFENMKPNPNLLVQCLKLICKIGKRTRQKKIKNG